MKVHKRAVHGILLLDKPKGLSSNQALQKARQIFKAEKSGHAGTLDPMATGLLPVLFGEASKFAQSGLNADKAYEAVMRLGIATTTGDAMGEIVAQHTVPEIAPEQLLNAQINFTGTIQQMPPMYSALKKNGVPLYRLARKGETVERALRSVTIEKLQLQQLDAQHIHLKVSCSKGTYIRTLAEDIAKSIGCAAHLVALRRTQVGALQGELFALEELIKLAAEQPLHLDNVLLPIDALLTDLPILFLNNEYVENLFQGRKFFYPEKPLADHSMQYQRVRLYNPEKKFFGVGALDSAHYLTSERLVCTDYL